MKQALKYFIFGSIVAIFSFTAGGCLKNSAIASSSNKMLTEWGTNYFNRAIIDIHNEVIEVDVKKWCDHEDSEAIIIVTNDGTVYYTHLRDCTLIGSE